MVDFDLMIRFVFCDMQHKSRMLIEVQRQVFPKTSSRCHILSSWSSSSSSGSTQCPPCASLNPWCPSCSSDCDSDARRRSRFFYRRALSKYSCSEAVRSRRASNICTSTSRCRISSSWCWYGDITFPSGVKSGGRAPT